MIFADRHLAQRLERTEARANAAFVETRRAISKESAASWIEVAGAYAMFDGIASPITQTFGLGLFGKISELELMKIEDFFSERGAMVCHEISPLAEASLISLLNNHRYQPIEQSNVMLKPIDANTELDAARDPLLKTRIIGSGEEKIWAQTSA